MDATAHQRRRTGVTAKPKKKINDDLNDVNIAVNMIFLSKTHCIYSRVCHLANKKLNMASFQRTRNLFKQVGQSVSNESYRLLASSAEKHCIRGL